MGRRVCRRGCAVLIAIGLLVAGSAPAVAAEWRPGRKAAIEYAQGRSGHVSFAVVSPNGRKSGFLRRTKVPAASVIKAMFMTAYLRQRSVKSRELTRDDKDLLAPMIKRSDNATATRIADMLGPKKIYRLARDAKMRDFSYTRPWGQSTVSALDQARFFFRLERYLPRRHEAYAKYLLSHITGSQRWGIGRVNRPKWKVFFKGGWGSGSGAVCHQVAFLQRKGVRIAVAVMITSSPSHEYATETLRGVFKRLLTDLPKP